MKKLILLFVTIILLLVTTSCHRSFVTQTISKDTTSHTSQIVYKDSIIVISGRNTIDTLWTPCDTLGKLKPIHIEKEVHGADIKIDSKGQDLIISGGCDTLQQLVTKYRQTIANYQNSSQFTAKTIQVKYIPKIYKISLIFSIFAIIIGIGFTLVKLGILKLAL